MTDRPPCRRCGHSWRDHSRHRPGGHGAHPCRHPATQPWESVPKDMPWPTRGYKAEHFGQCECSNYQPPEEVNP